MGFTPRSAAALTWAKWEVYHCCKDSLCGLWVEPGLRLSVHRPWLGHRLGHTTHAGPPDLLCLGSLGETIALSFTLQEGSSAHPNPQPLKLLLSLWVCCGREEQSASWLQFSYDSDVG